ncbi:MAG TPA: hypothetical protein VK179_02665 [Bacteroidales bacterium]|nr:hypothetical protein [Bacteroidales bacterium]
MKYSILISFLLLNFAVVNAQKIYSLSGGEMMFQFSEIQTEHDNINSRLRFTTAFHFGEYLHLDITNNFGLFSGIGLRNVGFITDENDVKTKYRSYNLGVPLALKAGSFRKDVYFFGGAEYEWMINFKQKTFRDGGKYKFSSWFSRRTPSFVPSVFAGIQFPGGIQLKAKYYLNDFLNHEYKGKDIYNDYTRFKKTQVWYISISYLIKNKKESGKNRDSGPVEIACAENL